SELKAGAPGARGTLLAADPAGRLSGRLNIARLVRGDVVREVFRPGSTSRPSKPWRVLIDAPDVPRVYFGDGSTLQAIDLVAGTTVRSMDTAALPFGAVAPNPVVVN